MPPAESALSGTDCCQRLVCCALPTKKPFEGKACCHPEGEIIRPHHTLYADGRIAVIPGAHAKEGEQAAGNIFHRHDAECIEQTAADYRPEPDFLIDGNNQNRQTIDGEHPYGGNTHEAEVMLACTSD